MKVIILNFIIILYSLLGLYKTVEYIVKSNYMSKTVNCILSTVIFVFAFIIGVSLFAIFYDLLVP
jgi:hypothetical protein